MNQKEAAEAINSKRTFLVKIWVESVPPNCIIAARPAIYGREKDETVVMEYSGPLDLGMKPFIPESEWKRERLGKFSLKDFTVDSVEDYTTALDTMPLRLLPLWAKEQWVKQTELEMRSMNLDMRLFTAETLFFMKRLIDEEREGRIHADSSVEIQAKLFKIKEALRAIDAASAGKGAKESASSLLASLFVLKQNMPVLQDLPWRDISHSSSEYNREDMYEIILTGLRDIFDWLYRNFYQVTVAMEGNKGERSGK